MSRFDDFLPGLDPAGAPWPVRAPRSLDPDRGRGALVGLAVGDAFGTTLEFSSPRMPPLPELARGPHCDVTGGGPFSVAPGQVTDDTQMAACLSASLVSNGRLSVEDVAARYVRWMDSAFDIGSQTASALRSIAHGRDPLEAGRAVWIESGHRAAGNGSLMRTTPIGLFFALDPDDLRDAALEDSAITHFDPRCQIACAAFNAAIAVGASRGPRVAPITMLEAARAAIGPAASELGARYGADAGSIELAAQALEIDLEAASRPDPDLYGGEVHLIRMAGFVRVAFRLSFWHLMHTDDYATALTDVVNRGGDADTNGAITGALLGSRLGESAIPETWRNRVLMALQDNPRAGLLATEYHPRTLLELMPT